MATPPYPRIADCVAELVDPRIERTKRHPLLSIVTIALCGVICGAESWVEVAQWGEIKQDWLRTWLEAPNGIPSHEPLWTRLQPDRSDPVRRGLSGLGAGDRQRDGGGCDRD